MIEVCELTKRYGGKPATDDLSFEVRPGQVTGFLGPNGAGKSTTMRMILGLDAPASGLALVNGHRYAALRRPLRRSARCSTRAPCTAAGARATTWCVAGSNGIGPARVDEVLDWPGSERGATAGRRFLTRHEAAAGHRGGAAGRPADPDVRRAGQRAGPRGHPLDPRADAGAWPPKDARSSSPAT